MKTINNPIITGIAPLDNLTKLAPADDILFFDIETTGLSKKLNHIYLIGCGYYTDEGLNIIQWFAENEYDEVNVLKAFIDFSSSFSYLVNYNGKSFDIPFTTERMNKHGLSMPELTSIDLYTFTKPLKKLLSLNDLTQKSIEAFLNVKRDDKYNGGELITVYRDYISDISPSDKKDNNLHLLLLHNKEDVQNMHVIVKILDYEQITSSSITYTNHVIKQFTDYNGNVSNELIIHGLHNSKISRGFNTFKNSEIGSYIMTFSNSGEVKIRIPIINTTLFYYLANYKDYYYLPAEDMCILKSMAGGVLKENRINATKDTCKVSLSSSFVPIFSELYDNNMHLFRSTYKSKQKFIRLDDFQNSDLEFKNHYIKTLFDIFKA